MSTVSAPNGRVLVACWTDLETDPRVAREIAWLAAEGWTVDTVGFGATPGPAVRTHYAITDAPVWSRNRALLGLALAQPSMSLRFRLLMESRMPVDVRQLALAGEYDLIFINDLDFVPWALGHTWPETVRFHLDLHEFEIPELPPGTAYLPLMLPYKKWQWARIGSPRFATRSSVAGAIANHYRDTFGIPRPAVVRNAPAYVEQSPTPVDPHHIRLIYHGHAAWARGLGVIIEAMALTDERFDLTLMLTGSAAVRDEAAAIVADTPRVRIVPPVPMSEVARALNQYDLEVMFFPPSTPGLKYALPNKLFEAVQGRLGLVSGESPSMTEIIEQYGNGVVVSGWTAPDLAATINDLTAERIRELKDASIAAAADLSAEAERARFVASIDPQGQRPE
ncbi:MAG: hypothetical protein KF761_05835 [Salinibacterium sp.]|nr:hypothetical protein [Salinibacterium sp.]